MACKNQRGFTILELMIAISVFTIAIALITTGVIAVGRYYQQGATKAKLLTAAREIHAQFTQAVQYSGRDSVYIGSSTVAWDGTAYYYNCIGNTRYLLSTQVDSNQSDYGDFMTEDISTSSCNSTTVSNPQHPLPSGAIAVQSADTEAFSITSDGSILTLKTRFVIGSKDMFNGWSDSSAGDYTKSCQSNVMGSEFCAVVSLTSTVARKVIN